MTNLTRRSLLRNSVGLAAQPMRRRERQMNQFKSTGQTQQLLSAHGQINNLFNLMSLPPSTELPGLRDSGSGPKSAAWVVIELPTHTDRRLHPANPTRQVDSDESGVPV
jgi:hypothetical protein